MTKRRIIAIDYGARRIGIAYSDETQIIAAPLEVLQAEKPLKKTVEKLLKRLNRHQEELGYVIEEIVVGYPLTMSGKNSFMTDEVAHFVETLKKETEIPVVIWDERLTSVMADRTLREANLSRKRRAKEVDKVSAGIILQSYLDRKQFEKNR